MKEIKKDLKMQKMADEIKCLKTKIYFRDKEIEVLNDELIKAGLRTPENVIDYNNKN